MVSLGLGPEAAPGAAPSTPGPASPRDSVGGGVGGKLMQWPPALSAHQPGGQPWASSRSNISAPLLFETRHAAEPHPSPQHPPQFSPALAASGGSPNSREGRRDWRLNVRPCGDPAVPAVRLLPPGNPGGPGEGAAAAGAGLRG